MLAGDTLRSATDLEPMRLALNLSEHVNGVAKRYVEVLRKVFPGCRVKAITNGVHPYLGLARLAS